MRIPLHFKDFSASNKNTGSPPAFSELIEQPIKCWLNEVHQCASKNVCESEFRVTDALTDDNFSKETVLAVAVWAVAIIFFLTFFIGVLLVVGMMILVILSFQHLTSLKKSIKSQLRLLYTIKKQLKRRAYICMRNIDGQGAFHKRRHYEDVWPNNHVSHHFHRGHHASNSPFHPRNNTPVSSCNDSFSSPASLSFSDLPSVSSFTPSVSNDVPDSEFTSSSRVTTIHPVSGWSFQRSREEVRERELQLTEPREAVNDKNILHDGRGVDLVLRRNRRLVTLQNCPPVTSYEPIEQSVLRSPKEYWL